MSKKYTLCLRIFHDTKVKLKHNLTNSIWNQASGSSRLSASNLSTYLNKKQYYSENKNKKQKPYNLYNIHHTIKTVYRRRNIKIQFIVKRKSQPIETNLRFTQMLELSDKHFEKPIINMLNSMKKMAYWMNRW